jgi:hypothetical protein
LALSKEEWKKIGAAVGLAVLTAILTISGEFLVEGRKANLEIWKAVQNIQVQLSQEKQRRQVEALYGIQSELKVLEGEVLLLSEDCEGPILPKTVRTDAAEAARTMSRIYPRVMTLDSSLQTKAAANDFLSQLSSALSSTSGGPTKESASAFLVYYHEKFEPTLAQLLKCEVNDRHMLDSLTLKASQ